MVVAKEASLSPVFHLCCTVKTGLLIKIVALVAKLAVVEVSATMSCTRVAKCWTHFSSLWE